MYLNILGTAKIVIYFIPNVDNGNYYLLLHDLFGDFIP